MRGTVCCWEERVGPVYVYVHVGHPGHQLIHLADSSSSGDTFDLARRLSGRQQMRPVSRSSRSRPRVLLDLDMYMLTIGHV